jgi:hypothetical protein
MHHSYHEALRQFGTARWHEDSSEEKQGEVTTGTTSAAKDSMFYIAGPLATKTASLDGKSEGKS